ncbi:MAG: hypothetical protein J6K88_04520 [Oscillospiraceae bacterium]|nr:hypothetical protein [Oscillospiraceae bacterium]
MISQKEIKQYLNNVKKNCPYSLRRRLSAELESAISEYAEENPDKTTGDLISRFGEADKYAEEYIMEMPAAERTRILKKGKTTLVIAFSAILVVFVAVVAFAAWAIYDDYLSDIGSYSVITITDNGVIK